MGHSTKPPLEVFHFPELLITADMIQQFLVRILLAPFSLLYGLGVGLNNFFYRIGLLKSMSFNVPVVSVGNLSVGGAGKTPHIEYLVRSLREFIDVATLSRGYKRKTRGFQVVQPGLDALQVGDEPMQFKRKFPDVLVAVAEDRAFAIPQIMMEQPSTQLILLDDAFQHRAVQPGLNVLLTEYDRPFTRDWLLPAGRLREWRSAYHRADVIIVSKCPPDLSEADAQRLRNEINPLPNQQIFFSYYEYQSPYYLFDPRYKLRFTPELEVLLISAIANTDYLLQYLRSQTGEVRPLEYEDHHYFSKYDISDLQRNFERMDATAKVIVTTEKDATRLELHRDFLLENRLPIFVLPVEVKFHFDQGPTFDQVVKDYLLNFTV